MQQYYNVYRTVRDREMNIPTKTEADTRVIGKRADLLIEYMECLLYW